MFNDEINRKSYSHVIPAIIIWLNPRAGNMKWILIWNCKIDSVQKSLNPEEGSIAETSVKTLLNSVDFKIKYLCCAWNLIFTSQYEANPAFWSATREGTMGPSYLLWISRIGPERKSYLFSHVINPLLVKLVRSRWLNVGLVHFCILLTSTSFLSIKTQKRTWPNWPHAWSITHL